MAAPSAAAIAAQIAGYQAAVAAVRTKVSAFAATAWAAQGSYRDGDIDRLVGLIVPRVQAGQIQVATLTSSYLGQLASLKAGETLRPVPVKSAAVTSGRGVPAAEVYRRPAAAVYTELASGSTVSSAIAAGGTRLVSLVTMDLQMAKVRQVQASLRATPFKYFRRTLTGQENCALCYIASTQRYSRADLLPIHPGCDCGVEPLKGSEGDDQVIDPERLEQTHGWAHDLSGTADRGARDLGRGNARSDYLDLIVTQDHGEYGPTLAWRGQKFTGPGDLA